MDDISLYQVGMMMWLVVLCWVWDYVLCLFILLIWQMVVLGVILVVLVVGMVVYYLGDVVQISIEILDGCIGMLLVVVVFLVDVCIQIVLFWGVLCVSCVVVCLLMVYYFVGKVLLFVVGDGLMVLGLVWMVVVCGVMLCGMIVMFCYYGYLKQE